MVKFDSPKSLSVSTRRRSEVVGDISLFLIVLTYQPIFFYLLLITVITVPSSVGQICWIDHVEM